MAWFKFTRPFDHEGPHAASPSGRGTTAYKPTDRAIEVPDEVADAAEAAGAGTRSKKAPRVTQTTLRDRAAMAAGVAE